MAVGAEYHGGLGGIGLGGAVEGVGNPMVVGVSNLEKQEGTQDQYQRVRRKFASVRACEEYRYNPA